MCKISVSYMTEVILISKKNYIHHPLLITVEEDIKYTYIGVIIVIIWQNILNKV